jgi:hypothetical protein
MGRVDVDHMAGHEPVKEHAERGQVLLDGRRRDVGLKILDEGGDMERLHRHKFVDALTSAPGGETPGGVHISASCVIVREPVGGAEGQFLCRRRLSDSPVVGYVFLEVGPRGFVW